ncbi:MAG: hypothetical protein ACREQL_05995 [Candidatus Binatia bacterium]
MALGFDATAARAAPGAAPGGDDRRPAPGGAVPEAPEELVEAKLRAILETTQTSAGAVCLFDQHQELLRLAVEVGLSDEGCRRLRNIRRGAATTWDMPLHSLLNRRAYLIESAAKNRYVPPLVDDVAAVRAVACIPLQDGAVPVGSLILVSLMPFGERQIRLLEQPVRDLVAAIVAMRKRVSTTAHAGPVRPKLSAGAVTPAGEVLAAGPITPGIKVAPGSAPTGPAIQAAVDRARAELERLRGRVAEAEDVATRERERATALEQQALTDVDGLKARLVEVESSNETLRARVAELEAAGRAAITEAEAAASAALADAGARTAAATHELETLRVRVHELEATHDTRLTDTESRIAVATNEADARHAAALADADVRVATAVADVEARGAATIADIESRSAAAIADAEARATATLAEMTQWQRRYEAADSELATIRISVATQSDQAEALAREREGFEAQIAAGREREARLERRVAQLQAEIECTRQHGSQFRDGFAHLESLIQVGVDAGGIPTNPDGSVLDLGASSTFEVVELDGSDDGIDDGTSLEIPELGLDIDEVGAASTGPAPAPGPTLATPSAPPEGLIVLDADAGWAAAAPQNIIVATIAPDDDVAAAVAEKNPERVLVNLATPNALAAVSALRAAGLKVPCFACLALPGQPRGVALGRFEVANRPLDPDALLALLQGTFTRGTRVVTAGADVDALISVRQALGRLGVSVSMAWDAKQASDLLAMVRPEVAIIDLDLPPKDGGIVVARLALTPPAPMIVVVPKAADAAQGFAAAMTLPELGRASVPYMDLLSTIAGLPLARSEPATPRR